MNPILESKEEAELVLERMSNILDAYEVVFLSDLHELLGLPSTHAGDKRGWTYLKNVEIRQIPEGYLLALPPIQEI